MLSEGSLGAPEVSDQPRVRARQRDRARSLLHQGVGLQQPNQKAEDGQGGKSHSCSAGQVV